ncbi:MAG: hypothetical protein L6461_02435 [Anaerolineae bacterium]|nr:hypothetical protein [Anaerolineae bacterium]
MGIVNIAFVLNRKPGILEVEYEANQSAAKSGFDLFAGNSFDVEMCIGYPTMRAHIQSYEGTGYATACAWIQLVTRWEFAALDALEAADVVPSLDAHPTLEELGVPFFAFGFPAEIFDAPCNNLNGLAKLEWVADTFLVTMPSRTNNFAISRLAGFSWGYSEYDLDGKRKVQINPLAVTGPAVWNRHLSLLRNQFPKWRYDESN